MCRNGGGGGTRRLSMLGEKQARPIPCAPPVTMATYKGNSCFLFRGEKANTRLTRGDAGRREVRRRGHQFRHVGHMNHHWCQLSPSSSSFSSSSGGGAFRPGSRSFRPLKGCLPLARDANYEAGRSLEEEWSTDQQRQDDSVLQH